MTQHVRNGKDAKKTRKRRADERKSYFESLSPEDRALLVAANKSDYDEAHAS